MEVRLQSLLAQLIKVLGDYLEGRFTFQVPLC